MVWYSHLFQNFPQFIVIHTVKGFGIVNKAEIEVFLELSCFFDDPADVGNLILIPRAAATSAHSTAERSYPTSEVGAEARRTPCLKCSLGISKRSLVFPILLFSSISLH